jgi:hypothetical protein
MVVSRSIVPPYSLFVKLSEGDKIAGKILTEGYIVQSKNPSDALWISYLYVHIAISLYWDLMFACPHKITGVCGTKIEKSCDFIENMGRGSRVQDGGVLQRILVCRKGGSLVNGFSDEKC